MKKNNFLILILFLSLFCISQKSFAQSQGANQLLVLPLFGYSDEQGLGFGANGAWLGVGGSDWTVMSTLYASTLYNQLYISADITNKKLFDFLYFSMGGFAYRSQRALYYGPGNFSDLSQATQYSILDQAYYLKFGVNIFPHTVAGTGLIYRTTSLDRGQDPSLPQYFDVYPTDPRISGTTNFTTPLFLQYDTRDSAYSPQSGELFYISWEQNQPWGNGDLSLQRLRIELQKLWTLADKTLILLTRAKYDHQWGDGVPFFLKSRIGGANSLRGFRSNRFVDAAAQVFNIEPRWTFWSPGGSVFSRFELSLGYEFGRVFGYENIPPLDSYHANWDLGLTAVLISGLPIRLDYASGPEGSLFYLHLFYPF